MAMEIKHKFQSAKADSADASIVRPSNWNDTHEITAGAQTLVGNSSNADAPAQEITLGAGLAWVDGKVTAVSAGTWTPTSITNKFNEKADKSQLWMAGDLSVEHTTPRYRLHRPNVRFWDIIVGVTGILEFWDSSSSPPRPILSITPDGHIAIAQLGYIYDRINQRALDWANDRVNALNYRLTGGGSQGRGDIEAPSGAVVTGIGSGLGKGEFFDFAHKYIQVYDPSRGWVTFHHE